MRIDKYKIIVHVNDDVVEETVNELLNEGWVPLGGVSIRDYGYAQAMVLPKDNEA